MAPQPSDEGEASARPDGDRDEGGRASAAVPGAAGQEEGAGPVQVEAGRT